MGMLLVKKWIHPADPVTRENPWEYSAQEVFLNRLTEVKARLDKNTSSQIQFEGEIEALMAHPESMAAAFSLEPGFFVQLFGHQRFERLAGPSMRTTRPRVLNATDLDARGWVLLKEVEAIEQLQKSEMQK
jgi:hypothetical protein